MWLANECGLHRETVGKHLVWLVEHGVIALWSEGNRAAGRAREYLVLDMADVQSLAALDRRRLDRETRAVDRDRRRTRRLASARGPQRRDVSGRFASTSQVAPCSYVGSTDVVVSGQPDVIMSVQPTPSGVSSSLSEYNQSDGRTHGHVRFAERADQSNQQHYRILQGLERDGEIPVLAKSQRAGLANAGVNTGTSPEDFEGAALDVVGELDAWADEQRKETTADGFHRSMLDRLGVELHERAEALQRPADDLWSQPRPVRRPFELDDVDNGWKAWL